MYILLLGIGGFALFMWGARAFANANPVTLARSLRLSGGILALAAGGVLTLVGRGVFGLPLIMLGLSVLGRLGGARFGQRTRRQAGQTSRVQSAMLDLELDIDSGALRGWVRSGPFAGRDLDQLAGPDLMALMTDVRARDREGTALLETYLDRRMPGWREDLQRDAGAGGHNPPGQGPMTEQEAHQILGLDPGAAASEIRRAHRELMKKLHPDQGGSNYLASRVNQAKDVLTRTER